MNTLTETNTFDRVGRVVVIGGPFEGLTGWFLETDLDASGLTSFVELPGLGTVQIGSQAWIRE